MNTTPQGWYRDPADRTRVRWFDGQTWTANSQPAPEPGSAPLPPPVPTAEAAEATRPRAAVATLPARTEEVPSPHPPVAMVIPLLEPDEPDEFEDEYGYDEPAAAAVAEPTAPGQPAAPEQPVAPEQAAAEPYSQPAAPPYGQGFAPAPPAMPGVPQQYAPAPSAPPSQYGAEFTPAPAQYGAEYAPAPVAQPDLPPYVAQSLPPIAPAPVPFGQPPAPFGQPPAAFGQAPFGQAPAAFPAPPTAPAPGFPPPGQPWQGGPQPWEQPAKKKMGGGKITLIVLASIVVGFVVISILAAIAIPVYLNQRARSEASGIGLDGVTCEQVADYAVQISDAGQSQDAGPLVSMTGVSMSQDNRGSVRVPSAGGDPAFVLSCVGTGTKPDGTTAPVTANLYIDSSTQQLVAYAWDE